MTFRKFLSMLLVFCMIFSFTACAGKNSDDDDDDSSKSNSGKKSGIFTKNSDSDNDKDSNNEGVDANKDDKDQPTLSEKNDDNPYAGLQEVALPKGYPKDIFPIYQGGKIYGASLEKRNGLDVYTIMAAFNADSDTLNAFYEGKIKDADELEDQSAAGFIIYTGKLKGYQFTLSIVGDSVNKKYSMMTLELKVIPTASALLESLAEGELPADYPKDKFPIIDGGAVYSSNEAESDGKVSYDITVYTDKSFKDIVAFYEEKIGAIEDKSKSISTDYFNLDGTANNYHFYLSGDKITESNVELVRYYISLDPAE